MEVPTIIAIVVGIVNLLALGFVGLQTYHTRKSVQLSEANLRESQQAKEVSSLPRAFSIISVQHHINEWKADLQLLIDNEKRLKELIRTSDDDIKINTQHWFGQAKGLISKGLYDRIPDWLREMLVVGAQYYYDCMAVQEYVCSAKEKRESRLSVLGEMIERARRGIEGMTEMLAYINKLVPRWYLESPASLNDSDFLS